MSTSSALPGFRDFYPTECAEREHVFRAFRAVARRHAFVEYDGPPLEPLELYTKKSGAEIVGQLYAFEDKGGRSVALRPEMTPSFARMVAARANSLRKPLRWFSIPQLFRYERAQKGRLREHFQLNMDIVGEPSEVADAELIAVAVDVMRELGLTARDVRVKVSDRRLLNALLASIGVAERDFTVVYGVLDKIARQPIETSREKLAAGGVDAKTIAAVMELPLLNSIEAVGAAYGGATDPNLGECLDRFGRYLEYAGALGLADWVDVDLSIVRGIAYYTGIVFELFDAQGEFRAICGGGRYDDLLASLGGTDLPALGFGLGDVVLSELLRARKLMPAGLGEGKADFYIIGGAGAATRPYADALRLARALREGGFSVDYALSADRYGGQAPRNQLETAKKSGARAAVFFDDADVVTAVSLEGRLSDAPRCTTSAAVALGGGVNAPLRTWLDSLDPPGRTDG